MTSKLVVTHLYKDGRTHEYPLNSLCETPGSEGATEYWTSLGPAVTCPRCLDKMKERSNARTYANRKETDTCEAGTKACPIDHTEDNGDCTTF